jgi:hypothetical protein
MSSCIDIVVKTVLMWMHVNLLVYMLERLSVICTFLFQKFEDDHNLLKNGRQPQFLGNGRLPQSVATGRRSKSFCKGKIKLNIWQMEDNKKWQNYPSQAQLSSLALVHILVSCLSIGFTKFLKFFCIFDISAFKILISVLILCKYQNTKPSQEKKNERGVKLTQTLLIFINGASTKMGAGVI